MDEVEARVRADIERHGWHVVKIPDDDRAPAWVYTIGLHGRGHPEIVVFGLDLETGHRLVNQIGLQIRRGSRYADGDEARGILEGHACAFRRVADVWVDVFLGNACWFYRQPRVPCLQCFWPDASGRFPWDPSFAADLRALQPLLYETPPGKALAPELEAVLREEGALV